MINVNNLLVAIRKEHDDLDKSKYSDWEVYYALNRALRIIANELSMRNTDFVEKTVKMLENPAQMTVVAPYDAQIGNENLMGEPLPTDFISEVNVRRLADGYKLHPSQGLINYTNYLIYQGNIFAAEPIVLKYRFAIPEVDASTTAIDLPASFFDFVVTATNVALDTNNADALTQYITGNAVKLIPSRRYGNARISLPWRV